MQINNQNIDELVFENRKLKNLLPDLKPQFDQWILGNQVPGLRFLKQKSQLEMLEIISKTPYNDIISKYFNENISIATIEYHIVKNYKFEISDLEHLLNNLPSVLQNITIFRDDKFAYLTFWK